LKELVLKLRKTKAAHHPKQPHWGHIVYTATAKILEKGDQKCLTDVHYGLENFSEN